MHMIELDPKHIDLIEKARIKSLFESVSNSLAQATYVVRVTSDKSNSQSSRYTFRIISLWEHRRTKASPTRTANVIVTPMAKFLLCSVIPK